MADEKIYCERVAGKVLVASDRKCVCHKGELVREWDAWATSTKRCHDRLLDAIVER